MGRAEDGVRVESSAFDFWRGKRIFLTGHTGFKGTWTALLLSRLGAEVYGFALPPEHDNGIFVTTKLKQRIHHRIGDIRDGGALASAISEARPEIVIHMAAQALVRQSYLEPVETYATNVMGTVNLLETVRHTPGVGAVVIITSDKCYDNIGLVRGYREDDRLGGYDPYSNSKACAELVTDAFRRSFFSSGHGCGIASGRAGNVIGGGDWAADRLVPDAVKAFAAGRALGIRNPNSIRPWQHVLDPISGYLMLAERLLADANSFAEGWNFGPSATDNVTVASVVDELARLWGKEARWEVDGRDHPHEAALLKLDCTKATERLGWTPTLPLERALALTVEWYRSLIDGANMEAVTIRQIDSFLDEYTSINASAPKLSRQLGI